PGSWTPGSVGSGALPRAIHTGEPDARCTQDGPAARVHVRCAVAGHPPDPATRHALWYESGVGCGWGRAQLPTDPGVHDPGHGAHHPGRGAHRAMCVAMLVMVCAVMGCKKTKPAHEAPSDPEDMPAQQPASASLTDDPPYYVVYTEGDAAVGYTFFDPTREDARVVVVRPASDPIAPGFEEVYDKAHEAKHTSQREGLIGFRFPEPVYTSMEGLAKGEPGLAKKMSATNLSKLLEHLRDERQAYGTLHDTYDGWLEAKPFEKLEGEAHFWRRANGRIVPDMRQVTLPSYDGTKTTLTYFTVKNEPPPGQEMYARPYTSRHVAWKNTVEVAKTPWAFAEPERIPDVDARAKEIEVVDAAFAGDVRVFKALTAPGVGELLINLDEEKTAKRFVMVDEERNVLGAYDGLSAVLAAHPGLERGVLLKRLLDLVHDTLGRTGAEVIHDADAWRGGFGDEGAGRAASPRALPSFASDVQDPKLEGDELVYFAEDREETVFRVRVDTRRLSERTSKKGAPLGVGEER
ncbi:MAG: hypothetical protein AAGI01_07430, partial [Myxococcota bacterium]